MSEGITANFVKRFTGGPQVQVSDLRISLRRETTVVFGPSGAGKTTLLRCLAGLEQPDEGKIQFGDEVWADGATGTRVPPRDRALGFVPQEYALFPHLTVERNVAYGLARLTSAERRARVNKSLTWLGLQGLEKRFPHELSGGQQQRVALARAVVCHPRMLLLDEPLSALDAPTRQRVRTELRGLLLELGTPTVLVTHDRTDALALGDQMVVMDQGHVIQQGPVPEVFSRPATLAAAGIVGVETVHPGHVLEHRDGLVTVQVGQAQLTALDPEAGAPLEASREVYACIRAEDVILMRGEPTHSSPRNSLRAQVRGLQAEGLMVRVELDCGFPLMALLTKQACEELTIKPNETVRALVKAPQIHLIPRAGKSPSGTAPP